MGEPHVHLDMVAVHFSTRCGAACAFCYASDPLADRVSPTPFQDVSRTLRKVASEEVKEVLFVGGDPIAHPNFLESVKLAKELGLTVSVLSNSWAIRPKSSLEETLSYIDYCEATILGATSDTHDALSGVPKSFSQLLSNLQQIADYGKSVGICANAMPQNLDQIYDIVRRVRSEYKIPVRSLMIQRIVPSGAAAGNFKFGLNLDHVEILMKQIDRVATEFGIPIHFEDPVPWCTVDAAYHKYLARCEWGYTRGAISSTGLLNRCGADDRYRLGSIWAGHIQEIWTKDPVLQSFRARRYLADECKQCPLLPQCGGGCPLSCGTLKDHDLDQLYMQRLEKEQTGCFTSDMPAGRGLEKQLLRYAYPGDLNKIVRLEAEIFGDSFPVFHGENIGTFFDRCPQAFRIVSERDALLGYSIVFPLNQYGLDEVRRNTPESVVKMDPNGIEPRFGINMMALYVEVIAIRQTAPLNARIALLKDLAKLVETSKVPIYTCPITQVGEAFAKRVGFVPVHESTESRHAILMRPVATSVAAIPIVFHDNRKGKS